MGLSQKCKNVSPYTLTPIILKATPMPTIFGLILCLFLCLFLPCTPAWAINIDVAAATLVDQDTGGDTWDIKFNLSWDYSWRIAGAPAVTANWDAAWIFVKFSNKSGGVWQPWRHATLLNTGNAVPSGSTMTFADNTDSPVIFRGVFM